MPSSLHEALAELFRYRPEFAADVLSDVLGVAVPPYRSARAESGDLTALMPTEYRADAVVALTGAGDAVELAIVVEIQLRKSEAKRWSWPSYLTLLRARLRCPTVLLVVCGDPSTAKWCRAPIELGHPGWVLEPLVLGPHQVPVIDDPAVASHAPELAALSAIAHGAEDTPQRAGIFHALLTALSAIEDSETAALYHDIVLSALPAAVRHHLEELMRSGTYKYQSEFARAFVEQGRAEGREAGREEGRVEGEASAVLKILHKRGISVSKAERERITACNDAAQIEAWIDRAIDATSAEDLFT